MNGQILKKYQQKELNLMHITCKKTRNHYFFFAAWETARKLNKQKQVTVPLKSKLPPSRETRLVSLETRLERNEMSLVSNETSLVSHECTGSTDTSLSSIFKPVLCISVTSCAVSTIFILISDACVPCVYCKNDNFLDFLRSLALGSYKAQELLCSGKLKKISFLCG